MRDRNESMDVSAQHPEIVNTMKALALAWKVTLPEQPRASAISPNRAKKAKKIKVKTKNKLAMITTTI